MAAVSVQVQVCDGGWLGAGWGGADWIFIGHSPQYTRVYPVGCKSPKVLSNCGGIAWAERQFVLVRVGSGGVEPAPIIAKQEWVGRGVGG